MINQYFIILFFLISSFSAFSQRIEIGAKTIDVEVKYGRPDNIEIWGFNSSDERHSYLWKYSNDTVFEVYNDTVKFVSYNRSISGWLGAKKTVSSGGYTGGNVDNIELEIRPQKEYIEGEPIVVDLIVKNITTKNVTFLKNEELYYVEKGNGSYFSASLYNEYDLLCKFPYEWDKKEKIAKEIDYEIIKPKKSSEKKINITNIVFDCICEQGKGLKKGEYYLSLSYNRYYSNRVKIIVN